VTLALVAVAFSGKYAFVVTRSRLDLPPEALAYRVQETLKRLGYTENPAKTAYGFDAWDRDYLPLLVHRDRATQDSILMAGRPAVIGFWYRQHCGEFWVDSFLPAPQIGNDAISYDLPPNTEPGMIRFWTRREDCFNWRFGHYRDKRMPAGQPRRGLPTGDNFSRKRTWIPDDSNRRRRCRCRRWQSMSRWLGREHLPRIRRVRSAWRPHGGRASPCSSIFEGSGGRHNRSTPERLPYFR
jgi:hypothetical protein